VAEAKYVELDSLAAKRKESQKQLRDTLKRIDEAVFGEPERLDRQSWLSRLADLMLDGIRVPAASGVDLSEWRRAMREGQCEIELRGVSHVFVPTATDDEPTEVSELPGTAGAQQEVYGRGPLKRLLMAYWQGLSTRDIRRAIGVDHLDKVPSWRRPSAIEPGHQLSDRDLRADDAAIQTSSPLKHTTTTSSTEPASERPQLPATERIVGWAYPRVAHLLGNPEEAAPQAERSSEWLSRVANATKAALQQLQLQAKLLDAALTPNSALLRFAGSANLTVDQVVKRRSELLTTFGLNVISIRPEPGAVVLAVEREPRQIVSIEALWSSWSPLAGSWGNQELLIGVRERDGSHLVLSPGALHAPHTLIAGSTGSGKSVLVQNILLAIAATNTPAQARIVMIDPKQGVDYFAFEGLPHLDGGIIDSQEVATQRLAELIQEMNRRYVLFREARSSNLAAYNAKMPEGQRLPVLWLVHDEFAEWMLTDDYRDAVSTMVQRLGVKARAAGIYLIFAAQRPDATVMPMQLRANLGNRLILRVDSEGTSEIALGERGAERLLGRGHLLAKLEGERDLIFAQVPLVGSAFIENAVTATSSSAAGSPLSETSPRKLRA
jgi:S-DNA-T family DNA segregation ATPase FtsK/SpoIIIE